MINPGCISVKPASCSPFEQERHAFNIFRGAGPILFAVAQGQVLPIFMQRLKYACWSSPRVPEWYG
jgi:hypothetical protein